MYILYTVQYWEFAPYPIQGLGWMQPVTGIYLVDSLDNYKTCTNTCLGWWEARPRCRYARYARIRAVGQHTNLPDLYIFFLCTLQFVHQGSIVTLAALQ